MRAIALLLLLFFVDLKSEFNSLVEAERAFARLSVEKGQREAFLANMNAESILFRPTATSGRKWFENNPAPTSRLSWEPAFADIAASGDLGYTTGPWEIRKTATDPPGGFGHYVTVWHKQDGAWKIAIDIGISHAAFPKPATVESPVISGEIQNAVSAREREIQREALNEHERRFPKRPDAYVSTLAPSARVYRNGNFPFTSAAAAQPVLAQTPGTFTWKRGDVAVSGSADLAYAYGTAEFQPRTPGSKPQTFNYLRIWKRERGKAWTVVLDLLS